MQQGIPESIGQLKISFKDWLFREYYGKPELVGHPSYLLAIEIDAKWPDFPDSQDYPFLSTWLTMHGACARCKIAFKDAWDNYQGEQ